MVLLYNFPLQHTLRVCFFSVFGPEDLNNNIALHIASPIQSVINLMNLFSTGASPKWAGDKLSLSVQELGVPLAEWS